MTRPNRFSAASRDTKHGFSVRGSRIAMSIMSWIVILIICSFTVVVTASDHRQHVEILSTASTSTTARQFCSWKRLDPPNSNHASYRSNLHTVRRRRIQPLVLVDDDEEEEATTLTTVEDIFQDSLLDRKVQLAALKSTTTRTPRSSSSSNNPNIQKQQRMTKSDPSTKSSALSSTSPLSTSSPNTAMGRVKMWPPWPFNLLLASRRPRPADGFDDDDDATEGIVRAKHVYPSTGALFWAYLSQQTRIGFRQMQELGSQLWFHTPPFFPPLVLIASVPRSIMTTVTEQPGAPAPQQQVLARTIPLFNNPLVRNLCLWGIFISLMSWSHSELHRKRFLVPLPLSESYRDINRAMLPPFLPDQVPELDFVVVDTTTTTTTTTAATTTTTSDLNILHTDSRDHGNPTKAAAATTARPGVTTGSTSEVTELIHQEAAGVSLTSTAPSSSSLPGTIVVEDGEDMDAPKSMKFLISSVPPRLRRHLRQTLNTVMITNPPSFSIRSTLREWKVSRQVRQLERDRLKRMAIYDELVALQKFKQQAKLSAARNKNNNNNNNKKVDANKQRQGRGGRSTHDHQNNTEAESSSSSASPPLGYALVTGSSRGIGRAIAVELARWDIPLILVARDRDRLMQLAYDLQACYGVKCCVLPADLSQPNAAQRIWETTRNAGLRVDILINNAGFSIHGLYVDTPLKETNRMLQVNAVSVAELNQLYGRDMKEQGRGRILVVSSVNGEVAAVPTVALYSATKAFEKSLALAMAKEMEPYGVGVTCLIPGAVRGTDFKAQSKTDEALCWKIPFYPLSPAKVAHQAVRGLLDGDVEITPGWMNRAFLKMAKPMLPQRIHNMVAELAWNPLSINWPTWRRRSQGTTSTSPKGKEQGNVETSAASRDVEPHQQRTQHLPSSLNHFSPPRLLEMEDNETKVEAGEDALVASQDEVMSEPLSNNDSNSTTTMEKEEIASSSQSDADRLIMME